ncbi:MAG: YraN family protein [Lachnospiraceae bacterium]|nr:YraN family protein [Lachnospiraceae bacterium]
MNRRTVGNEAEEAVVRFLRERGYRILERNYRCRLGEIDIVAEDGGYLVFAEVKYRRTGDFGLPEEAVDARKAQRIRNTALWYMKEHRLAPDTAIRFDVAAMDADGIRLYPAAF